MCHVVHVVVAPFCQMPVNNECEGVQNALKVQVIIMYYSMNNDF